MARTGTKDSRGPRYVALQVLCAVDVEGAYVQIALDNQFKRSSLVRRDRGFATELVYGTLRRRLTLDWILARFSRRPLEAMPATLRNNLRMALYQLVFLNSIPPAIVCNEAVELAKKVGHRGTVSFVNGVLRAILRNPDRMDYVKAAECMATAESISLLHSHPLWLVNTWIQELGTDETKRLCASNNQVPSTFFRANTLKISRDELIEELTSAGLNVGPGRLAPEAVKVEAPSGISRLASFEAGYFAVQDEAAMLVAHALAPAPRGIVYDLCAGLGGKTLHLAALMENNGQVLAFDIHGGKLQALGKMADRLGVENVRRVEADATRLPREYLGKADGVLLDAPCSGWGVIGRKPDIRWRMRPEHSEGLVMLQRQLLETAYACLVSGGRLVYSTCTIHRKENQENVEWLLDKYSDLELLMARAQLPYSAWDYLEEDGPMLQLLPHRHGTDGFFIAVLEKS